MPMPEVQDPVTIDWDEYNRMAWDQMYDDYEPRCKCGNLVREGDHMMCEFCIREHEAEILVDDDFYEDYLAESFLDYGLEDMVGDEMELDHLIANEDDGNEYDAVPLFMAMRRRTS